jgi:aconitase A
MNFLASPEVVTAMSFAGSVSFNPMTDYIDTPNGPFKFSPPTGSTLPEQGFTPGDLSFSPSPSPVPVPEQEIVVSPTSQRLELLEPFSSPFPADGSRLELPVMKCLMRVRGKCTTDHISAAGPWLKYKGHLSNISENTLITAVNDEGGAVNVAFDGQGQETIPNVMKRYKAAGQPWMLVVDENYGEGSAREHAALQPRFYGCNMIVARSFARIHETNLKKQGVLPVWFADKADYAKISAMDTVETEGLDTLLGGDVNAQVTLRVTKPSGEVLRVPTKHTMSVDQLNWLRAGSALNYIAQSAK